MDGSELGRLFRTTPGGPLWAQVAFAVLWVLLYVAWARVYFRVLDPALRHRLGASLGEDVRWVLRRGAQRGGGAYFSPRYDTWTWGLDPAADRPLAKDVLLYVLSVLTVYVAAGLWPIGVLYGAAFHLRLLSPPFVLLLFCLAVPLYGRFWSARWHGAQPAAHGAPAARA